MPSTRQSLAVWVWVSRSVDPSSRRMVGEYGPRLMSRTALCSHSRSRTDKPVAERHPCEFTNPMHWLQVSIYNTEHGRSSVVRARSRQTKEHESSAGFRRCVTEGGGMGVFPSPLNHCVIGRPFSFLSREIEEGVKAPLIAEIPQKTWLSARCWTPKRPKPPSIGLIRRV